MTWLHHHMPGPTPGSSDTVMSAAVLMTSTIVAMQPPCKVPYLFWTCGSTGKRQRQRPGSNLNSCDVRGVAGRGAGKWERSSAALLQSKHQSASAPYATLLSEEWRVGDA